MPRARTAVVTGCSLAKRTSGSISLFVRPPAMRLPAASINGALCGARWTYACFAHGFTFGFARMFSHSRLGVAPNTRMNRAGFCHRPSTHDNQAPRP